jgi:hypothetical protein
LKLFYIALAIVFVSGGMCAGIVFAQTQNDTGTATGDEASIGQTYTALALAIISMAGTVFAAYLSQKAKATGQAPNETDLKIQQQLTNLHETMKTTVGAQAQLIDFVFNKAVPEKAQEIIEGTLPLIKVQEVTKKVGQTEADVKHAEELLNEIQSKVVK